MIIALSRPVIDNGEIKVKSSFINTVVAIDMSKSMFSDDVYPSRFEFAKKKFMDMLMYIKNTKVAIIGFSSQTFLISPLTQDYHSLKYLTTNLSIDNLTLKGTDILNTLKTTNELFESEQKDGLSLNQNKILILFTDGGDSKSFDDEIEYAKAHNISVYIYNIGTSKGGVIKDTKGDILKDDKNNIVVTKINTYIKELALKSGGAYLEYSLDSKDIKMITANITQKFKAKEEDNNTIKDTKELFYYPLLVAILLYIIGLFSLPNLSKKDI
jgi:Ca-activated chloride channel family protein